MNGINDKQVAGSAASFPTPGPGNYEDCIQQHYSKIPGSKINKDERKSFFLKTSVSGNPDPGNYEKAGFDKLNANPKFAFGKSKRDEPMARGPPGPGQYNYIN